ncbi:YihY/virulence factor BrkB family protein [Catenulispora sp. NL8]|uniref:YihY/virulence factor BrkB family protein n=1 Tax=Catenulispora pinistramenti TaxID=2705254 RepID=A0ABS5L272_9ACTN|nr:YihY/virulence factor BrkB family protein [Catenulispora pinistramenti]MBS2552332.1 YihY/virulence factor BrkB family protein [Catenulispora pinistramenti]
MSFTKVKVAGFSIVGRVVGRVAVAYHRYAERSGNFVSAAVAFYGFLALFPLTALAAAVVAATLSPARVQSLQRRIADEIPGIADKVDVHALVSHAGTVGVVGAVVLVYLGLNLVAALRPAIREIWFGFQPPAEGLENLLVTKVKDAVSLLGLGVAMAVSVGSSTLATSVIGHVSGPLGLVGQPVGRLFLRGAGLAVGVGAGVVMFAYLLVGMPRLEMPRRVALQGALIGAVGFEVLKALVASYISGVASKSMYGAFGVPAALLLWIYLVARLLLFCAAWTATCDPDRRSAVCFTPPGTEAAPE